MDEDKNVVEEPKTEETATEPVKDRTSEQFDKLTTSNKTLKQENEALKDLVSSLTPDPAPVAPNTPPVEVPKAKEYQNLSQGQIDNVYSSLIDEQGYLDGNKLLSTLKDMDERVKRAEETSERVKRQAEAERVAREEDNRSEQVIALHTKYPTLDPKNEGFDKKFYDLVKNEMIGQMLEGKQDPIAAADKWAGELDMNKQEKEQKQEADTAKSNINASVPRVSSSRVTYDTQENEALRQGVMQGKKGSLAELLRRREQGKA